MAVLYLYCVTPMSRTHILGLVAAESHVYATSIFCNKVGFRTMQDYTNTWSHGMRRVMVEQSDINNILDHSICTIRVPNLAKLETLSRHYDVGTCIIFPSLEEIKQCMGFKSIAKYKLKKYCL